jgi:hypothetical protein
MFYGHPASKELRQWMVRFLPDATDAEAFWDEKPWEIWDESTENGG